MRGTRSPFTLAGAPLIFYFASPFSAVDPWKLLCNLWSNLSNWRRKRHSFHSFPFHIFITVQDKYHPQFFPLWGEKVFSLRCRQFCSCWMALLWHFFLSCHWAFTEHQEIITENWETVCVCVHIENTSNWCSNVPGNVKYLPHNIWLLKHGSTLAITRVMA